MPDNPQPASDPPSACGSSPWHALPEHHVLQVSGRDAAAFMQAQCMNDMAALADGHWQWSGWLTPKGRVIALFALLKLDAETLWVLLPDMAPDDLAGRLQRYMFRSKVAFDVRGELRISAAFAAPVQALAAKFAGGAKTGIELDFGGDGGPRTLRIGLDRVADAAGARTRWSAFDLAHGLPRLDAQGLEQWTPQQLSLQRLRAYSVKKGCYPGQEIVARTHFLGQAKRGLVLLEGDAPLAVGSQVHGGERLLGSVVSSVGGCALAVLALEREIGVLLQVGGMTVRERPLQDGLAR